MKTILTITALTGLALTAIAGETNLADCVLSHLLSTNTTTLVNFKRGVPSQIQATLPGAPLHDDGSEFQTLEFKKKHGDWRFERIIQAGIH